PRYQLAEYGEWRSAEGFEPLSFDRPEPVNFVPEGVECTDPIEGRQACHLAPAEWRLLGWLEREGYAYDLYADCQLPAGFLDAGAMTVAPYEVLVPDHWVFAGTGLRRGDRFGTKTLHERYGDGASGHETDKISASSPRGIPLLARGLNPDDGGAHLTCFETAG